MLFNSYVFVLAFLPACLAGYFFLNHLKHYRTGLLFLLCMSLLFYGYFNVYYLAIICSSIMVNYIIYRLFRIYGGVKQFLFIAGLLFNLGLLGYFKYYDFFIENINFIFGSDLVLKHILLPLGISFFTFQQISFLVDMYKEKEQAEPYSFLEYAAYVAFFPQLVAGPIVTHDVLVPQLKDKSRKSVSYDYLSKGIALFTLGLAKKVLLADVFGNYVNLAYEDVDKLNSTSALLAMLGYTLQIYFDFSGYSDMAIGLAWMMRIDLPVNFNSPYISQSVREFWKRWHMTLTAFLTKYVYFPLGGSRVGTVRTYINILIVFLVSGLWHGAGWTFVIWGFLHGMMQVIERMLLSKIRLPQYRIIRYLQTAGSWLFTFAFVNVAWILFRANDMQQALAVMKKIILFDFGNVSNALMNVFSVPEFAYLVPLLPKKIVFPQIYISSYFVSAMLIILLLPNAKQIAERCVAWKWTGIAIAFLLTWCVFSFAGVSTFIYFNF